jgi:GT2 family glycosyltransferase
VKSLPQIIVPIHNAAEELDACLAAISNTVPRGTTVLLIDDASDDLEVRQVMTHWAARPGPDWQLRYQARNLGFVGTVNQGMRETSRDVVLLNSDTEVTAGWLEGLARCLASDHRVATATPWTNNGEIASLPEFCRPNPVPPDPNAVAEVIATTGIALYPRIPTAVGFCMAISRLAIEALGLFDEAVFGAGYGEENDFSMRASAAGMLNLLCDDSYVVHHGGRSFGPCFPSIPATWSRSRISSAAIRWPHGARSCSKHWATRPWQWVKIHCQAGRKD